MMNSPKPPIPEKEESKSSIYSFKNLFIRLLCIVCLSFAIKTLLDRGQTIFVALVSICLAGFVFSLILFLAKAFKSDK